jgi:hypothetical protein
MSGIKHKEAQTDLQIKSIDILEFGINLPQADVLAPTQFNFNVEVESGMNRAEKTVTVIVSIEITPPDQKVILASIKTGCQFRLSNFEEIIQTKTEEAPFIPQTLLEAINSISISTSRGILYSQLKGTYLHTAILPVLETKAFTQVK